MCFTSSHAHITGGIPDLRKQNLAHCFFSSSHLQVSRGVVSIIKYTISSIQQQRYVVQLIEQHNSSCGLTMIRLGKKSNNQGFEPSFLIISDHLTRSKSLMIKMDRDVFNIVSCKNW